MAATDVRQLARWITQVEAEDPAAVAQLRRLDPTADTAYRLGVTGPPGAGKSTLVDQLIRRLRAGGSRVAVIAIDPSSPFSGGAVLGDRVRMQAHAGDDGVFIRSLGSRGAHGGLSQATAAVATILAHHGFDWIIIETVGVGQSEFDIMALADTTLVVLVPEAGDTVQTLKAGLLEVADLFVVNKADRAGAEQMTQALSAMVELGRFTSGTVTQQHDAAHRMVETTDLKPADESEWRAPVLQTTATQGQGMDTLLDAVRRHRAWQQQGHVHAARRARMRQLILLDQCVALCRQRLQRVLATDAGRRLIEALRDGTANPYAAAETLMAQQWRDAE